jgi:hypothetical protein
LALLRRLGTAEALRSAAVRLAAGQPDGEQLFGGAGAAARPQRGIVRRPAGRLDQRRPTLAAGDEASSTASRRARAGPGS